MLSINSNIASLNAQRSQTRNQSQLGVALQRLSSGLRINSAKDDAAGLAISERMTTQIRGMSQARRNINDAVSMMQTSEGALGAMTGLLQRGRELAIQAANATNSDSDRNALQAELDQLVEEVDRIASTSAFNGVKLFDGGGDTVTYDPASSGLTPDQERILDSLKTSWLEQSEQVISDYLGLDASGYSLEIIFEEDTGPASAYVSYIPGSTDLELHINTNTFISAMDAQGDWPNQPLDILVAHEMTHAVMAATTSMGTVAGASQMPKWFAEGIAEFVPGGDIRLANVLAGGATVNDVINELDNIQGTNWDTTNIQYAAAYVAVSTLHEDIIGSGTSEDGVKHLTEWLAADKARTLDDYFSTFSDGVNGWLSGNSANDFVDNFVQGGGAGANFINNKIGAGDLNNLDDIGAIGGFEAQQAAVAPGTRDASWDGTVPDTANLTDDPLVGFTEVFPSGNRAILLATTETLQFQVGANAYETIEIDLVGVSAGNIGLDGIDIVTGAQDAIGRFDVALDAINAERARLGAVQNRLEMASINMESTVENVSAARSRIQDADFAVETATLTRSNILSQAGVAIIAQSNALPSIALSLLAS